MASDAPQPDFYDVVIIGGSLSGASVGTLLRRELPDLRILILEKSTSFERRVGEATVEVSAYFLGRVLGMTQHMNDAHLVKQGMRFWFSNEKTQNIADASEIGGRFQVRLPSYQLDRAVFDTELLRRTAESGVEVRRPANVRKVDLMEGGEQTVQFQENGATQTVRSRWVVDASGVASVLARQEGWRKATEGHPTASAWARWRGVRDLDGQELAARYPEWAATCYCIRGTATNHVVGDGWWSWWIPLKGGDTSVGVVFDQRLADWPRDGAPLGERLKAFLCRHPVGRELLENAEIVSGDVHWRKDLPYHTTRFIGDGHVLVGDSAVFIDPLYSPGMDWIAFTATAAVNAIVQQQRGEDLPELIEQINRDFIRSYERWFEAVYRDKYEYIGEFDLMRLAFNLDLGLYYMGIVSQPFRRGPEALLKPPFSEPLSVPVYHLMRFYNRRFAALARKRRARGGLGRRNDGQRNLINGYTFSAASVRPILINLMKWGLLEIRELFAGGSGAVSSQSADGKAARQAV